MDQEPQELSEPQRRIYEYIAKYSREFGRPPTIREIGHAVGISSTGHVDHHLKSLTRMGYITRERGKSRGLTLSGSTNGLRIVGAIAAGVPLDHFTDREQENIELPARDGGRAYVLVVRGNSMIEDHITDGDYVLVDPDTTIVDGDIVVALHAVSDSSDGGAATLKRLYRESGRIRLQPANSTMTPIYVDAQEWDREWQVQGKVIGVYRKC